MSCEENLFQFPSVLPTVWPVTIYTFLDLNDFIFIADNVEFNVIPFDTVFAEEIALIYRVFLL